MFLSRNRKIMYIPVDPSFTIKKWSLRWSNLYRHVFMMNTKYMFINLIKQLDKQAGLNVHIIYHMYISPCRYHLVI